jgi:HPt (histidine-containing phosphotransfer) domain-containing protein
MPDFRIIDLRYMREVSNGDKAYEKAVTELFLERVPAELDALQQAWSDGDRPSVYHFAHSLKTTVSVMGLNPVLNPLLDEIEDVQLSADQFQASLGRVWEICAEALQEAKELL